MRKSTSQLRRAPQLHAKRRKQEGEHARVKTCTLQLVLDPWILQLLMAVTTLTIEMFTGGTLSPCRNKSCLHHNRKHLTSLGASSDYWLRFLYASEMQVPTLKEPSTLTPLQKIGSRPSSQHTSLARAFNLDTHTAGLFLSKDGEL